MSNFYNRTDWGLIDETFVTKFVLIFAQEATTLVISRSDRILVNEGVWDCTVFTVIRTIGVSVFLSWKFFASELFFDNPVFIYKPDLVATPSIASYMPLRLRVQHLTCPIKLAWPLRSSRFLLNRPFTPCVPIIYYSWFKTQGMSHVRASHFSSVAYLIYYIAMLCWPMYLSNLPSNFPIPRTSSVVPFILKATNLKLKAGLKRCSRINEKLKKQTAKIVIADNTHLLVIILLLLRFLLYNNTTTIAKLLPLHR